MWSSRLLSRLGSSFSKGSPITARCSSSSSRLFQAQVASSVQKEDSIKDDASTEASHEDPKPSDKKREEFEGSSIRRHAQKELEDTFTPYRFVYPEFLPDPTIKWRNRIREKLERIDMLNRRAHIDIPEFYVGSVLSVTVSDPNSPGKTNTFVGICIERGGTGLRANFTLRNVVDGMGVEINYDLYNPTVQNITCLKLEKRIDENLRYLRDAPAEYSTFPFDMSPELRSPDAPVPINPMKVKLKSKPWSAKWQLWNLKGIEDISDQLEPWQLKKLETWKFKSGQEATPYDLMKTYRSTIPAEEQTEIYSEVMPQLSKLRQSMKKQKRKMTFVKPQKTA